MSAVTLLELELGLPADLIEVPSPELPTAEDVLPPLDFSRPFALLRADDLRHPGVAKDISLRAIQIEDGQGALRESYLFDYDYPSETSDSEEPRLRSFSRTWPNAESCYFEYDPRTGEAMGYWVQSEDQKVSMVFGLEYSPKRDTVIHRPLDAQLGIWVVATRKTKGGAEELVRPVAADKRHDRASVSSSEGVTRNLLYDETGLRRVTETDNQGRRSISYHRTENGTITGLLVIHRTRPRLVEQWRYAYDDEGRLRTRTMDLLLPTSFETKRLDRRVERFSYLGDEDLEELAAQPPRPPTPWPEATVIPIQAAASNRSRHRQ